MGGIHAFTSFTYSYLSRARVLAKSIRRHHPDWTIWAIIVDSAPPGFPDSTWRNDFDNVLDASSLFSGVWARWIFKHDIVEACTAVKAHSLLHILSNGADKVIYLDPDIAIFGSLQDIVDHLDDASIILTPHLVEPNHTQSEIADNELSAMQHGIYNLGFLALHNDSEGRRMAKWWASRLFHACYADTERGLFTDQKYCDLVPSLFSNVRIERDPGYNVASWNLSRRSLEFTPTGDVLVNKSPLRFYHFTKINSAGDIMTERYAKDASAVFEIWNWYKRAIKDMELPGIPSQYWRYARFDDGTSIPKNARLLYRSRPDLMSHFTEPFRSGADSFQDYFTRHESQSSRSLITLPPQTTRDVRSVVTPAGSVAAIVHAYYPELLPEISDLLAEYTGALKLFVTTTTKKFAAVKKELEHFAHPFEIFTFENHGRDVLPFLRVLPKVFAERHDYILKLHTKKSDHIASGDVWRRELIASLADSAELTWIIDRLQQRPEIGVVGPTDHVLDMNGYWGSNEACVRNLAKRMGVGQIVPKPNVFVAGNMFVARREALLALLSLDLSNAEFEAEMGQTDGTLAHAVERVLTFSAAAHGLLVAGKPTNAAGSNSDFTFEGNLEYRFAPRSDLFCSNLKDDHAPTSIHADSCLVSEIRYKVLKIPNVADKNVCLFITFAPTGQVYEHVLAYIRALRSCGLNMVLVVVTDEINCKLSDEVMTMEGVLVRANHGWDFAAWASALTVFPQLWRAHTLIFANDSVYGPVNQSDLAACIQRICTSKADFVGMTDSWQLCHHVQSYFFAFTAHGISKTVVKNFWTSVRSFVDKDTVIQTYELTMLNAFQRAELAIEILFPTLGREDWINPTLMSWRELLARGYPFIKVQLLRDPLSFTDTGGWQTYLHQNVPLRMLIESHLGTIESQTKLSA